MNILIFSTNGFIRFQINAPVYVADRIIKKVIKSGNRFVYIKTYERFDRDKLTKVFIYEWLRALPGNSLFAMSIRNHVIHNFEDTLTTILSQHADSPALVENIVGKELILVIKKFRGVQ